MSERLRLRNIVLVASLVGVPAGAVGLGILSDQNTNRTSQLQVKPTFSGNDQTLIVFNPTPTPAPLIPSNRRERMEASLEEEFGVTLLDREEYLILDGRVNVKPAKVDWNQKKLVLLEDALRQLPAHFYSSDFQGDKLTIVIEPSKGINGFCRCVAEWPKNDGSVHINDGAFRYGKDPVRKTVAHELTHNNQPWITDKPGSERFRDYTSPWVIRRDEILGTPDLAV